MTICFRPGSHGLAVAELAWMGGVFRIVGHRMAFWRFLAVSDGGYADLCGTP